MHLFALKLQAPERVTLLRGNHEDSFYNGSEDFAPSFRYCCKALYGDNDGEVVWQTINDVFDCLPLAAIVDGKLFGCHGGIPRRLETSDDILDDIRRLPCTPIKTTLDSSDVWVRELLA
jgi:protein phosphatase